MFLESQKGCLLAIGSYPKFEYDATGGGGKAFRLASENDNFENWKFDPDTFSIPALSFKTTRFLGLPMPPCFEIKMLLDTFEGTINRKTGEACFAFEAQFNFSIFMLFHFPSLFVKTSLVTREIKSQKHLAVGKPLQDDGRIVLVGVAVIQKTGNKALDFFLSLPNEALAVLKCKISEL